jgi:hypothetical protein
MDAGRVSIVEKRWKGVLTNPLSAHLHLFQQVGVGANSIRDRSHVDSADAQGGASRINPGRPVDVFHHHYLLAPLAGR